MRNDRSEGRMEEGEIRETENRERRKKDGGSGTSRKKMSSLRLTHSHGC